MALKVVMQNDGDFLDVILLYKARILNKITSLWKTCFFLDCRHCQMWSRSV